MSHEITYELTADERHTLLFLTGNLKCFWASDVSQEEIWNVCQFFNITPRLFLKLIVFKNKAVVKIKD